jgi:hypothetical protein
MKIGVVTVTYNSAAVIDEFLDCALAQSFPDFNLIVVDNASQDDSLARLGKRPDLRIELIANRENLGVATGNNQGIRRALELGCNAVLLLNNDTAFPADLFATLARVLGESGADMVTPKITYYDRPDLIWCAGGRLVPLLANAPRHRGMGHLDDGRYDVQRAVDYAPTCCVLMRSSLFGEVGLMDDAYFVYWDDVDFMLRARRAGKTLLYTPAVALRHKVSSLTGGGDSPFTMRYNARNQIYFIRKHYKRTWRAWVSFQRLKFWLRRVIGKDSPKVYEVRTRAIREGISMPVIPEASSDLGVAAPCRRA